MPPRRPSISRGAAPPQKEEGHRINGRIDAREVRLIGADGANIGVVPIRQAIMMATPIKIPGTMPAINSLVMLTPPATPKMIMPIDGGITGAMMPPQAIRPQERFTS